MPSRSGCRATTARSRCSCARLWCLREAGEMDDATRAELAQLRRRAFGPDPDIAGDHAAMDRLVALEALVLSEHAAAFAALHSVAVPAGGPGDAPTRLPEDDEEFGGATYSNHI